MILELLISIIISLIFGWMFLLPDYTGLPAAMDTALISVSEYLKIGNSFFPMDTLFLIGGIIFGIEAAIYIFKMFNWIFDKVRGAG